MVEAAAELEPGSLGDPLALGKHSKPQAAIALILLSAVFIASAVYAPAITHPDEPYFSLCIFKLLTGLPCPACGLSHSFCAIANGDLMSALKFNLLGPPVFLMLILAWIRSLCVLLNKMGFAVAFDKTARRVRIIRSLAIAFLLFGAMRILWLLMFH